MDPEGKLFKLLYLCARYAWESPVCVGTPHLPKEQGGLMFSRSTACLSCTLNIHTGFFRCGHTLWGLRLPLTITTTCDLLSADELETMATGDVYDIIHSVHKETIPLLRVGHFGMGAGDLSL